MMTIRDSSAGAAPSQAAGALQAAVSWLLDHLWITLPVLALPAIWSLLAGEITRSFDSGLHLLRLAALDRYIARGELLPRWIPEMLLGYGYPVFNFYGPGSYYVASAFHLVGLSEYRALALTFAAAVIGAGAGMYLLARDVFGGGRRWAPLVAATAYMYAPYLGQNIYIRGAIAESLALALLPWVFWSVRRLFYTSRPILWVLVSAFSLGALAITHNITLLFVPPVLVGYMAIHWWLAGRRWRTLGWATLALAAAMGISAFFWLPLLVERSYLAATAFDIARTTWLPRSAWTRDNFLDTGFVYTQSVRRPIPLGLVQLVLGVGGFLAARRRDAEWLYFAVVALVSALLISSWSLPLWLNSDVLSVAQFPWRLLSILSLPLALFVGGWVPEAGARKPTADGSRDPRSFPRSWRTVTVAVSSLAVIALVLITQTPRVDDTKVFNRHTARLDPVVLAQNDVEMGVFGAGEGNSTIQEFRPRWADRTLLLREQPAPTSPTPEIVLVAGNDHALELTITNAVTTPLRFGDFYFPGWQVTLDGVSPLATYPSTNLGLLTVDVPPGSHTLRKTWQDQPVHVAGTLVSLAALAGLTVLAGLAWRDRRTRLWALLPATLLVLGLSGWLWPRQVAAITTPQQPLSGHGIRLLGYRSEDDGAGQVILHPYWQVSDAPPEDLYLRWQVLDADGRVLGDTTVRPYLNTTRASNWPADTVVDDAAHLPLPPGLPAGTYQVAVAVGRDGEEVAPAVIGVFTSSGAVPANPQPPHELDATFADRIQLRGFDLRVDGRPVAALPAQPAVAPAGAMLDVRLYWQALASLATNYHGFVHLVDEQGAPLAQADHLPGPHFSPPTIWQPGFLNRDVYKLRIPGAAPSGLYRPLVGLYTFDDQERLPVQIDGQAEPGDHVALPPIKIVQPNVGRPRRQTEIRFGDVAELIGYDLDAPAQGLRAGTTLTVTLYYQGLRDTDVDLTRFVHLHNPQTGMAAQFDSPPQGGANPTWAWLPGEIVRDEVVLSIAPDVGPGRYRLLTGLYNPQEDAARLPAFDRAGAALPDQVAALAEVEILP
jgi:hypothetical protein